MIKDIIKANGRTLLICIAISLALYMTAAWKSAIYLHPDEYYQIVEFASYKMHITTPDQMAWEFGEKIRPAFQPLMCYVFLKAFGALHISDHYTQLYLLRIISGLLSLFSITFFCISSLPFVNAAYRRIYIVACFLFWYPYTYGVHFSSETWAGCAILIAVSLTVLFYHRERKNTLVFFSALGLLMGAAFLLRFQTAFMSIGILGWLLFIKKERAQLLTVMVVGLMVLASGVVIDYWFYGEWICTPWNYFDSAFIHKYTEFGSKPFYFYPLFITLMLTPPIGLLIIIGVLVFFFTQPRTIYTWALLPFLLMHTIIGHKEFRFMYPVMSFFPFIIVMAYQSLTLDKGIRIPHWLVNTGKGFVAVFNVLCLIIFVFFADSFLFDSKIFLEKIHELAKTKPVIVYCKDINNSPFVLPKATIPKDLYPEYMRDRNVTEVQVAALSDIRKGNNDTLQLIATNQYEYRHEMRYQGQMLQSTLTDLAFIRALVGEDVYKSISENTYYLIEYGDQ